MIKRPPKKRHPKRIRLPPGSLALTGAERDECSLWPTSDPDDVSNWIQLQPNELVIILKQNPSNTSPFIDHNSNYTKVLTSDGLIGWIWSEDLTLLK
jgi:hypothetical protein